ncbi:DUF2058 family protein [Stenotrophomonas maltophilia]|jgi:uncharacterized protein YaiL (DUF2058 family)|uniref:Nucleoprotein/polynucleotide-associated enzyme n=1 Tax=Stenotrophomonas maltophilia TaxID=40324 RepID=A0AAP7GRK4_STEMA|nr:MULTISPECIES: DUF2058 family protein [Stenotrophomonas]KOQ71617.1 nucleoprotein/polynucleotide-associated enzyme [Stenotrophomonas maltophilia]MBA0221127.1 DUF2058 family protein [Stenotrophomonas maltophilia]MBH1837875.1 DUF2058 family protein [Stenotrophomonas maltophilia]MBN4939589.1 DUF2058 family protein [Stenotrophomonas maltophilia]MCO7400765.1 DUF2058 family protein [Stenotrophomonas maltophilia]
MSDTLRDQLLGLGFKPAPKPERKNDGPRRDGRPQGKGGNGNGKPQGAGKGEHTPGERRGPGGAPGKPGQHRGQGPRRPRSAEEMDLAKAYAIRAQKEKEERIEAERLKQEEARQRREAKAKLEELLKDKGLNDEAADIARHFPYGGKIKRIYVTAAQLTALNAGELGVVQLNGRYLLVTAEVLNQAEAVFAASVALKVDPDAPAEDDPYADPQYQVPDDLVW